MKQFLTCLTALFLAIGCTPSIRITGELDTSPEI